MTDTGTLSIIFSDNVKFSKNFNKAIIILKKVYFKTKGKENINEQQLNEVITNFSKVIDNIKKYLIYLEDLNYKKARFSEKFIENIYIKIYENYKNKIDYFLDDLERISTHLKNLDEFNNDDLFILDQISQIISSETVKSYKKLMKL